MKTKREKFDCLIDNMGLLEMEDKDAENSKSSGTHSFNTQNNYAASESFFETIDPDVMKSILDIKPHRPSIHIDPDWESGSSCEEDPFDPKIDVRVGQSMFETVEEEIVFGSEPPPSEHEEVEKESPVEEEKRDITQRMLNYAEYLTDFPTTVDVDLGEIIEMRKKYEKVENNWYDSPWSIDFVKASGLIEELWKQGDGKWDRWVLTEDTSNLERRFGKNLDIPLEPEASVEEMSDYERKCHGKILGLIKQIKESKKAYKAVRLLYKFHKENPKVKLRPYIADMDYFLVRYIVWGLNFYAGRDERKPIQMKESDIIRPDFTGSLESTDDFYYTGDKEDQSLVKRFTFRIALKVYRVWRQFWNWIIPHD